MAVEEQDTDVEGLPTRYPAPGMGPPLVLLPGAGDNSLDWRGESAGAPLTEPGEQRPVVRGT